MIGVLPKIRPFENNTSFLQDVKRFDPYLSSVGYSGASERALFLSQALGPSIRVCPLGEMQRPPLGWQNGGINLVDLLN